jgi:hypothetical protein
MTFHAFLFLTAASVGFIEAFTLDPISIGNGSTSSISLMSSSSISFSRTDIYRLRLYASNTVEEDDKDRTDEGSYDGYNPFTRQYQSSSSPSSSSPSAVSSGSRRPSSNNVISLRKTRMQDLTRQLLDALGEVSVDRRGSDKNKDNNEDALRQILDDHRDFLLEPLEDQDAVLDPDSIYKPNMTRLERYDVYRSSMDQRIGASRSGQACAVLTAMRDYVLEFE